MTLKDFIPGLIDTLPKLDGYTHPWDVVADIEQLITQAIAELDASYVIKDGVAVHETATVADTAIIHAPAIIAPNASIGHHALLRGGAYVGSNSHIGQGVELKHSMVGSSTALAHFNYVGDSLLGDNINLEAGSVIANHHNDRVDKTIYVLWENETVAADVPKFGALVGDACKLGANSVTSPGTILAPQTIIKRLELVNQTETH